MEPPDTQQEPPSGGFCYTQNSPTTRAGEFDYRFMPLLYDRQTLNLL